MNPSLAIIYFEILTDSENNKVDVIICQWIPIIRCDYQLRTRQQNFYRPKRSFGQGNIFRSVCHSVHRGGVCSKFWGWGVGGVCSKFSGGVCSKFSGGCLLQIFGGVSAPNFRGVSAPNFGGVSTPNFWGGLLQILGGLSAPNFWRGVSVPNFGGVSVPNFRGGVCSKFLGGCLLQIFGEGVCSQFSGGSPIFGIRSTFGRYASYWNAFLLPWFLPVDCFQTTEPGDSFLRHQ